MGVKQQHNNNNNLLAYRTGTEGKYFIFYIMSRVPLLETELRCF